MYHLAHSQQPTLPDIFTNVPAVTINNAINIPPKIHWQVHRRSRTGQSSRKMLDRKKFGATVLRLDKLQKGQPISWAAYYASRYLPVQDPCSIMALLPHFLEKADSPAMVKHGLDMLKCITEFLNVGKMF